MSCGAIGPVKAVWYKEENHCSSFEVTLHEENPGNTELVERIRSGDTGAEAILVDRFQRGILIILRRLTRNQSEAEDLFQETFRLALEKIRGGQVREPERLPGFMSGLARNLAIGYFRKKSKQRAESVESFERSLGKEPTALARLVRQEQASAVRKVIGEMKVERDRQLIYRYYIAEEDKESICRDFGLSSLHFNRVIHRARQRYKEVYQRRIGEAGVE